MTTVEFAVVVPVFFLFVFGIIEIGRGLMVTHLLTNAARAGCREGVLEKKSTADITAAVNAVLNGQGLSGTSISVTVNDKSADASTAVSQDEITVVVTVPVANVTWLPGGGYLNGKLTGQYNLRRE